MHISTCVGMLITNPINKINEFAITFVFNYFADKIERPLILILLTFDVLI